MKKVFIDTNVFLDFIAKRGDFYAPAASIISLASQGEMELAVSSLSFATGSYVLESHYKMSQHDILKNYKCFITLCGVTTVNEETIRNAVETPSEDFEDAMQYHSALMEGADIIITRNVKDFQKAQIPVLTPQEFLQQLVHPQ